MALTWLHLSDFHVSAHDSYDRDVVLRALVSSIANFKESGRQPDLIFATGDIAYSGKPEEYERATKLLDDLLEAAGLKRQHLFVIPGNHDVDRAQAIGLARSLGAREESDSYFGPDSPLPHLTLKQAAFRNWYRSYFSGIRECPDSSCGPVELVEVDGQRVAILPINSALFCQDDHDHAKLWVGRRALDAAASSLSELDADLRIALIHHPLEWLADLERSNIRTSLVENVDLLLRGHLHESEVEQAVFRHGAMIDMAAGAAYQTRRWPNRALYVTLEDDSLTVFPIRYEDSPKEIWTVDPSVFPADEGHMGRFNLLIPGTSAASNDKSQRPSAETPASFRSNVPSTRGLSVVGREKEIAQMEAVFSDLSREQVLVLTGPPGVGKSELAREFARRKRDRYPGGTFLIDATTAEMPVDLARVGSTFIGFDFPPEMKLEEQCEKTLAALGGAATLLIYDNVHSFDAIERWLPPSGMTCHVVITTVHEPAAVGWKSLSVNPLSKQKSEELIAALAPEVAEKYGGALASHAGGLPVQLCPITSVLAYEERRGRNAGKYVSALADETLASFSLVYELLDPPVRLLLHAAAGLNSQRIDKASLQAQCSAGAGWSESQFNAALDACLDVHLLEGDTRLRMHQLLDSFLQSLDLGEESGTLGSIREAQRKDFVQTAVALFENPADGDLATSLLGFKLLPGEWRKMGPPLSAAEREPLAMALLEIGEFAKARPWFEEAAEEARTSDQIDHQRLGSSLHRIGYSYSRLGDFAEARNWYEKAVKEKRKGDLEGAVDHESLGRSLYEIGQCYVGERDFTEARGWYEKAVEEKRKGDLKGAVDHESLGRSLHEIGYCYSGEDEFAEARGWYEKAVEEKRKGDLKGKVNHESLGRALHQVGFSYSSESEFAEARGWYEKAVEEKQHGDDFGRVDHESLGSSLHQVGHCYSSESEFAEARGWYEKAVEERRKGDIHGRIDHESVSGSLHQIGYCYASEGEFSQALPWFEEAIEKGRLGNVHGRVDHQRLALKLGLGAHCLRKLGQDERAAEFEAEAQVLKEA